MISLLMNLHNFLLTNLIFTCSAANKGDHESYGWPSHTYSASKIGVSALTRIQQRLFDQDPREDLIVNSVHPGWVDTDMTKHQGPLKIEEGELLYTFSNRQFLILYILLFNMFKIIEVPYDYLGLFLSIFCRPTITMQNDF